MALTLLSASAVAGCGGAASKEMAARDASGGVQTAGVARGEAVYADNDGADAPMAQAPPPMTPGAPGMAAPQPAPSVPDASGGAGPGVTNALAEGKEPMLVYTAHLTMAVFESNKALDAIEEMARKAGGYLVRRDDTTITVRVPSKRFQSSLEDSMRLGDVLHRRVDVRDVTEEYTDLVIRLRNAEAMRKRLEELLARAENVKHALEVERELERVAGEIERMKGRIKLLGELVSYSTLTVEFRARPTDHVQSSVKLPFPWLEQLGLGELLRL